MKIEYIYTLMQSTPSGEHVVVTNSNRIRIEDNLSQLRDSSIYNTGRVRTDLYIVTFRRLRDDD
jgi:hypothetical protein